MSSYAELGIHRYMLRDAQRNEAYRRALKHVVKPGDTVLDVGAGTGILSVFAAAAGARRVYAVERTAIADVAREVIECNGYSECIEVMQSDLEDVTLPERVDVIVSEWMGGFGVDENILAPLVMARDRWLRPGGTMVPGRVTAMMVPAHMPDYDDAMAHWRNPALGIDLSVIAELTAHENIHTQTPPSALVAEPQRMWSHDPHTCSLEEADQAFTTKLVFEATAPVTMSGILTWFVAEMGDGTTLSNAVGGPDTHWGRSMFPLDRAIDLVAGSKVTVELVCAPSMPGTCEFSWTVQVDDRTPEVHETRRARRDAVRKHARARS
ncbi:MAG: 50S ribosomal protein L11 methyltransferase [Deltaproteobacteria bacterium]|nr:50S ribosomal protein L11 methyltransferase [Deltaproteobacteria bacterium]